jgi:hypothetical protein
LTVCSEATQYNSVNTIGFAGSNVVQHHLQGIRRMMTAAPAAAAVKAELLHPSTLSHATKLTCR